MSHMIKCDRCPATIEMEDEDFGMRWAELRDANDNSAAGRDKPLHLCQECVKSFNVWAANVGAGDAQGEGRK